METRYMELVLNFLDSSLNNAHISILFNTIYANVFKCVSPCHIGWCTNLKFSSRNRKFSSKEEINISQHPSLPLTPNPTSPLPSIKPLTTLSSSPQNGPSVLMKLYANRAVNLALLPATLNGITKSMIPGQSMDALRYVLSTTELLTLIPWPNWKPTCETCGISPASCDHIFILWSICH